MKSRQKKHDYKIAQLQARQLASKFNQADNITIKYLIKNLRKMLHARYLKRFIKGFKRLFKCFRRKK